MIKPLITALVLLASPVVAQEGSPCAPRQVVIDALMAAYGENFAAQGMRHGPGGPVSIFEWVSNEETGSWTLLETTPDGMTCMVASGSDYSAKI